MKGSGNGQALLKPVPAVSGVRPVPWAFFREPLNRISFSGQAVRCASLLQSPYCSASGADFA